MHIQDITALSTYMVLLLYLVTYIMCVLHSKYSVNWMPRNFDVVIASSAAQSICILLGMVVFVLVCTCLPIYHSLSLVEIMRGMFGDLSITTLLILSIRLIQCTHAQEQQKCHPGVGRDPSLVYQEQKTFQTVFGILIICLGSLLYLSTLGIIGFDIYALGYYPNIYVLLGIIAIEVFLWHFSRTCAWIWIVAIGAYYFKLQASINLWDYLFDPVLWLYCLWRLAIISAKSAKLNFFACNKTNE